MTDVGAGLLRTFLRSPGNLTPMFGGIIDRVVEARVRHDVRELGTEGGKVQYDHFELGGTYLHVKGAADETPWDYRVGMDNTLYIEDKGLSDCRKAIIWSVMAHIAKSIVPEPR
ncbi:hypothetical protein [Streptomyces sp. NPDC002215]|uniref:hypothetical protein n=1 Tax=Streptomyces sp. NPDC002215 TaxID=3154412 RepID=UPI00331857B6